MEKIKKLSATALFAALIFVLTFFVRIPSAGGYIHPGDSLLYICALALGSPWAALSGALGEGLADIASGFSAYVPATVIIKCAAAFCFALAPKRRLLTAGSILSSVLAGILTVGGYYIADLIIDKGFAVAAIPGNAVQAAASAAIFAALAAALDSAGFKERFRL